MIVGRAVLGLGVGTAAAIAPLYIAEVAPTRFRGALVTVQSIAITGGQFFSYCIGIPLTGHNGWRIQFAIGIVPAVVQAAVVLVIDLLLSYNKVLIRRFRTVATSFPSLRDTICSGDNGRLR